MAIRAARTLTAVTAATSLTCTWYSFVIKVVHVRWLEARTIPRAVRRVPWHFIKNIRQLREKSMKRYLQIPTPLTRAMQRQLLAPQALTKPQVARRTQTSLPQSVVKAARVTCTRKHAHKLETLCKTPRKTQWMRVQPLVVQTLPSFMHQNAKHAPEKRFLSVLALLWARWYACLACALVPLRCTFTISTTKLPAKLPTTCVQFLPIPIIMSRFMHCCWVSTATKVVQKAKCMARRIVHIEVTLLFLRVSIPKIAK